jgi:hypothetical protein
VENLIAKSVKLTGSYTDRVDAATDGTYDEHMTKNKRRREIELSLFIDDLIEEGIITREEIGEEVPDAFKRYVEWEERGGVSSPFYKVRKLHPQYLNKIMNLLAGRSEKIRPSLLVYTVDETAAKLLVEREVVAFRKNTTQYEVCRLLFGSVKKSSWSWDELAEEMGEDSSNKLLKSKIYKAYYDIAKKINAHAPDLVGTTMSEVSLNPSYEIRRIT